jgi:hypothetical protein
VEDRPVLQDRSFPLISLYGAEVYNLSVGFAVWLSVSRTRHLDCSREPQCALTKKVEDVMVIQLSGKGTLTVNHAVS